MISNDKPNPATPLPPPLAAVSDQTDVMLSKSEHLTAEEVIRRRHRRIMQLNRVYRDHYWTLMAELRRKYRDYMWNFGSPYIGGDGKLEDSNLGFRNGKGKVDAVEFIRCAHTNCSKKPMAMTKFCHAHILSDPKQVLYKGCTYITSKSGSAVQTVCAKPILRSTTPSFCNYHLPRAKKSVSKSLKKAGLSTNDSNNMASVIHIISAEFVHAILRKRRSVKESTVNAQKMEVHTK
ncbi:unnamed protein product [Rhodiola kirilowii]